jgi:hypothetical protein
VSWNKSRFSQWEVEGEVRQRVGKALAAAEQDRLAKRCQVVRERSAVAGVIWLLKAGPGSLLVRARARWEAVWVWLRAPQVLEKGGETTQEAR